MFIHIWVILTYRGIHREQKHTLINHVIISLNATELSILVSVLGTGKFNFRCHFNIIKLIKQSFICEGT